MLKCFFHISSHHGLGCTIKKAVMVGNPCNKVGQTQNIKGSLEKCLCGRWVFSTQHKQSSSQFIDSTFWN